MIARIEMIHITIMIMVIVVIVIVMMKLIKVMMILIFTIICIISVHQFPREGRGSKLSFAISPEMLKLQIFFIK